MTYVSSNPQKKKRAIESAQGIGRRCAAYDCMTARSCLHVSASRSKRWRRTRSKPFDSRWGKMKQMRVGKLAKACHGDHYGTVCVEPR